MLHTAISSVFPSKHFKCDVEYSKEIDYVPYIKNKTRCTESLQNFEKTLSKYLEKTLSKHLTLKLQRKIDFLDENLTEVLNRLRRVPTVLGTKV